MNLYQKYRPQTLDNIFGHENIKKDLRNRAKNNSWPKVSYYTGNTGVGKTTFQRIQSKMMLCLNLDDKYGRIRKFYCSLYV